MRDRIESEVSRICVEEYGKDTIRTAIMSITPELLIQFFGLNVFDVARVQYNFQKNTIDFAVQSELLPEAKINEYLPTVYPVYKRTGECQVELISIELGDGKTITREEILQARKDKEA